MLNVLYSSIVYLLGLPVTFYFFYNIAEIRSRTILSVFISIMFFEIGSILNVVFNNTIWLNFIILFSILFSFSQCCFKIKLSASLLYSVVLLVFCGVWEFATIFLVSAISNSTTTDYNNDIRILIVIASIGKLFYFFSCLVFIRFVKRNQALTRYPLSFYLYPIIVFACLLTFWYISANEPIKPISKTLFAVLSLLLFYSSIMLFVIYQRSPKEESDYIRVKAENERLQIEKKHYDILEYQNRQLMLYAHDAHNHLSAISSLNDDPRIEQYIKKLIEQLETYKSHCHSGNKILDVILDKYYTECELADIRLIIDVRTCNLNNIDEIDLVAILSNLFDNALRAAKASIERTIRFETAIRNSFYVIVLNNSCDIAPISNGVQLISTKRDSEFHGLGLKSVLKILKKYDGDMSWDYDPYYREFSVTVMISPPRS